MDGTYEMADQLKAQCPLCAATVALPAEPEIGELMDCEECGEELEITSIAPPTLAKAPEEEEDWGE